MSTKQKSVAPRLRRKRVAIGPPRPQYLDSKDADKVVMMLLALAADVSALRDRIDTHEALAEQGAAPTSKRVESYKLDGRRRSAREAQRHAMIGRILRVLTEEVDALRDAKKS